MASKKTWHVKVTTNPTFCGTDVGGTQFAHGEADVHDPRIASWFREHDGYEVTTDDDPAPKADTAAKKKATAAKKTAENKTAEKKADGTEDVEEPEAEEAEADEAEAEEDAAAEAKDAGSK